MDKIQMKRNKNRKKWFLNISKLKNKLNLLNPYHVIDNGNLKQELKEYKNKQRRNIYFWIIIVLALCLFSLLVLFVQPNYKENIDYLRLFQVSYREILQILITGMCLGSSAYLLQRITNNRLVDTSTVGIGNICLVGLVTLALSINFENQEGVVLFNTMLPIIFVLCGIIASIFLYYFSKNKTSFSSTKLIVGGVFINFIAIALAISLKDKLNLTAKNYIEERIMGSFGVRNDFEYYLSYALFAFCMFWLIFRSPKYKIVITNINVAQQLGLRVKLLSFEMVLLSGVLTAVSYIMAGNVLFLGIASANIAYSVFGKKFNQSFISSGIITSLFLMFSHFFLKNIIHSFTNFDFPAPIITPILIAPIFIVIVMFRKQM